MFERLPMNTDVYFSGKQLIGNDFSPQQVEEWFRDEKEASLELRGSNYKYAYHALNWLHAWRRVPKGIFERALAYGGGTGAELLPIASSLGAVTILESSTKFTPQIPAGYAESREDGTIPFPADTFDLVTCLNVLHHIPRVSFVIQEISRVTKPGGYLILNEPTTSMGDWREKRPGLTPRERGIPIELLRMFLIKGGFEVLNEDRCMFAPLVKASTLFWRNAYNSRAFTVIDWLFSNLPVWTNRYYSEKFVHKVRPVSVFFILRKQ
jgi:SAM-dependent methyltransferase